MNNTKLDLGCGESCHAGFDGVDIVDYGQKYVLDIDKDGLKGIKDESVDELLALDFLEHILDKVFVMNECWRVAKFGTKFHIKVPRAPDEAAFSDPAHVSFWTEDTFRKYFSGIEKAWYGIKKWKILKMTVYRRGMDVILLKDRDYYEKTK
jgi:predicted SAM-dependent methyltransferase